MTGQIIGILARTNDSQEAITVLEKRNDRVLCSSKISGAGEGAYIEIIRGKDFFQKNIGDAIKIWKLRFHFQRFCGQDVNYVRSMMYSLAYDTLHFSNIKK